MTGCCTVKFFSAFGSTQPLIRGDLSEVFAVVNRGLAFPGHTAFRAILR
jgi:hypothetical protein